MEEPQESAKKRSRLESGLLCLVLAALNFGAYVGVAGNEDQQQIFALITTALAVGATDRLMTHFRGLKKDN